MSITPEPDEPSPPNDVTSVCPQCQTINPRRAATCWRCYAPLPGYTVPFQEEETDWRAYDADFARRVRMARMTGVVLAFVVLLVGGSILFQGHGPAYLLGSVFFAAAAPSLVYLFRPFGERESSDSNTPDSGVTTALTAIAIAFVVIIAAVVMFVVTCFPIGLATFSLRNSRGEVFALAAGFVAGGVIAYLLVRAFFRKRPPPSRDFR